MPLPELRKWVSHLLSCKSIDDMRELVRLFGQESWTLEDRSIFSAIYTPKLLMMVSGNDDKWSLLEDISALCWNGGRNEIHAN